MDKFVANFTAVADRDLMLCHADGVAYQADMSSPVAYDAAYFDKYVGYEGSETARRINAARVDLVNRIVGRNRAVLDIGIGSGSSSSAGQTPSGMTSIRRRSNG